jgi:hypothetical protein
LSYRVGEKTFHDDAEVLLWLGSIGEVISVKRFEMDRARAPFAPTMSSRQVTTVSRRNVAEIVIGPRLQACAGAGPRGIVVLREQLQRVARMRRQRNARALLCRKAKIAESYPALRRRAQALAERAGGK